jgi:hypothetical protein
MDTAILYDSAGNDTLTAGPTEARLVGGGMDHTARGFEQVRVFAGQGYDLAFLRDSAGNDTLVGRSNESRLSGTGFDILTSEFEVVQVTASGGYDQAYFYDSPGVDTFTAGVPQSSFTGRAFSIVVSYFDRVRAYGNDNQDRLVLVLPGTGYTVVNQWNAVQLRGYGFDVAGFNFGSAVVPTTAPATARTSSASPLRGLSAASPAEAAVANAFEGAAAEAWMHYLAQSRRTAFSSALVQEEDKAIDAFFTRLGQRRQDR